MFVLTHAADISEVEKVITSQRKIMKTFLSLVLQRYLLSKQGEIGTQNSIIVLCFSFSVLFVCIKRHI